MGGLNNVEVLKGELGCLNTLHQPSEGQFLITIVPKKNYPITLKVSLTNLLFKIKHGYLYWAIPNVGFFIR